MTDRECVALLQWALPRLRLRWQGLRRVRGQVRKRLTRRIAELGLADVTAYRARLETDANEWAVLDRCCWISISRFNRDRGVFERLASDVLPELASEAIAQGRTQLRAWSAGCASGEEPYSLRLLWDRFAAPSVPSLELEIVATDASETMLARARRAVYPRGSLKELDDEACDEAFESCDDGLRLKASVREGVSFVKQDLRDAMPDGPFDLILCRNLAFTYFDEALQRQVLDRIEARLHERGALVIGAHEQLPGRTSLANSGHGIYTVEGRTSDHLDASPPEAR